jgi:hypothetical protein
MVNRRNLQLAISKVFGQAFFFLGKPLLRHPGGGRRVYVFTNCIVLYHNPSENTEEFVLVLDVVTRYPKMLLF